MIKTTTFSTMYTLRRWLYLLLADGTGTGNGDSVSLCSVDNSLSTELLLLKFSIGSMRRAKDKYKSILLSHE